MREGGRAVADNTIKGLTPDEQDELANVIASTAFSYTQAVDHPRAILTGGQPGSGKSYIVDTLAVQFEPIGGIVTVDPDAIRPRLPYMQGRIAAGELDIPDVANIDAGTVAYKVVQLAKAEQRNVLIDGTLQNTPRAIGLAKELTAAGYQVEMHGMAVYPDLSHARTYTRREAQIATSPTGFGRGVGDAFHDQAVAGFAKTVDAYQVDKLVTTIALYNSGNSIEAECSLVGGQWEPQVSMADVLRNAHGNPTPAVRVAAVDAWQLARDAMRERRADDQEQSKVTAFRADAISRLDPATAADRFDAACAAETAEVRRRADRLQAAIGARLDTLREAVKEHRAEMPVAPKGPAGWLPGAERAYGKKLDSWVDQNNALKAAADRLEKRLDRVAEYAERPLPGYPGRAERLAETIVSKREPELARVASVFHEAKRIEDITATMKVQEEQQQQRRARSRGL